MLGLEVIVKLILMAYLIAAEDSELLIVSIKLRLTGYIVDVGSFGPEGPTVCGEENSTRVIISLGIVDW